MSTLLCAVFRARRNADTYLYVDHQQGFARVPPGLLEALGGTDRVLTFGLKPDRKLARANAAEVLAAIESSGYYLQLPPVPGTPDDREPPA